MTEYRRKKYLTEKKYQIRYTLVIILSMIVMAVIIGGLTYWDIANSLGSEKAIDLFRWENYVLRVFLLLIMTFMAGIFFSHKVIGPLSRVEKALQSINQGEYDINLKLRNGDEFSGIADEINILAENLKKNNTSK